MVSYTIACSSNCTILPRSWTDLWGLKLNSEAVKVQRVMYELLYMSNYLSSHLNNWNDCHGSKLPWVPSIVVSSLTILPSVLELSVGNNTSLFAFMGEAVPVPLSLLWLDSTLALSTMSPRKEQAMFSYTTMSDIHRCSCRRSTPSILLVPLCTTSQISVLAASAVSLSTSLSWVFK